MTLPRKPRAVKRRTEAENQAFRLHPAKLDALFTVLDAIAWMDSPDASQVAQFAGIDPRTAGKLLPNAQTLGLVDVIADRTYTLALPYPYKGSFAQKEAVVREALVRLPILASVRQFVKLGDALDVATRKAATVNGVRGYDFKDFSTLLEWAQRLGALKANVDPEQLLDEAEARKRERHQESRKVVAFLSHSSRDKPFIRQLASDLNAAGVGVWLDEQRIRVGDSIPERIAQGLADSDYFLIAISENSLGSSWVQKELNSAMVHEIERRRVSILPLKLDTSAMPPAINDKKYADFSTSYRAGLDEVLKALEADSDG